MGKRVVVAVWKRILGQLSTCQGPAANLKKRCMNYIFDVWLLLQEALSLIRNVPNLVEKVQLFGLLEPE